MVAGGQHAIQQTGKPTCYPEGCDLTHAGV